MLYFLAGLMELPVKNLEEPPPSRLLRKVDAIFVSSLKMRLLEDPSGIGAAPLAVVCKDVEKKEQFQERLKSVYKYEVQGGLHGAKARQCLLSDDASQLVYASVHAIVYVGLTDEEALRLASRHNINGHYNHSMTHRDYVSFFYTLFRPYQLMRDAHRVFK